MLCDRLHAWWLTQSLLTIMLPALIAGLRLNDGSGVKLLSKLAGAWCSVFGRALRGSTVWRLLL